MKRSLPLLFIIVFVFAKTIFGQQVYVPKGVLAEHFKASWCGICPEGQHLMDQAINGNSNVFEVSIHDGDIFEIPVGVALMNEYAAGFPTAMFDRFLFPVNGVVPIGRFDYSTFLPQRLSDSAVVAVSGSTTYDNQTNTLQVSITADFVKDRIGDMRFNCILVEDSLTGSPQVNGDNNFPGSPFFGLGDPIVNYAHPNVLRAMLGGAWGTPGVIADTVLAGDQFTYQYTFQVPQNWNTSQLKIAFVVQEFHTNPNKREILNILSIGLNEEIDSPVGVFERPNETNESLELVSMSSNYSIWDLSVEGGQRGEYFLYGIDGRLISKNVLPLSGKGKYRIVVEHKGATPGIYILNINTKNGVLSKKLMLN